MHRWRQTLEQLQAEMRIRQRRASRERRRLAQLRGREEAILLAHQDGSDLTPSESAALLGGGGLQPMTAADWRRCAWSFPELRQR
jgi:hypothetical protein